MPATHVALGTEDALFEGIARDREPANAPAHAARHGVLGARGNQLGKPWIAFRAAHERCMMPLESEGRQESARVVVNVPERSVWTE